MHDVLKTALDIAAAVMNGRPYTGEFPDDETAFFRLIHENGLSGVVFHVLDKDNVKEQTYKRFARDFYAYQASDVKQEKAMETLAASFNEHGIDHVFLKGANLKTLYPEKPMRAMGDIDVLVRKKDLETSRETLPENGFLLSSKSEAHDVYHYGRDVAVEVHPTLYKSFDKRYENLFEDVWQHTVKVENHRHRFTREFETAYLLYHLIKHFRSSGVGLRSVLDIGVFLRAYESEIDKEKLRGLLEEGKMTRFFQSMLEINRRAFQIEPFPEFLEDFAMDDATYEETLVFLATSGIHGHGKAFNRYLARGIQSGEGSLKTQGRVKVFFRILFPSLKSMRGMYPYLEKRPYLLPFAYLFRFMRLLFKSTKDSFRKLARFRTLDKRSIDQTRDLYDKLGL